MLLNNFHVCYPAMVILRSIPSMVLGPMHHSHSYLFRGPWRYYDQFNHLIRFHLDVALELLSKVLVKVRVVPLSNLSHVPSLQSLNLPPSNFGLMQQRYCILVAWVHIASFGQWLDRQSVLILITALRLLVAYPYQFSSSRWSRLRHCLPVRCNPTAQTAQL